MGTLRGSRGMSTLRGARRFAIVFFAIYTLSMLYPVAAVFRGPRPFLLGLPFAMIWISAWIVAAFFVLLWLDRVYSAHERSHAEDGER